MATESKREASCSRSPRLHLPNHPITTDTLRQFIKNDPEIVLRTNFGDFFKAQGEVSNAWTELLQIMLERINDPAVRANKLNEQGSNGSSLLDSAIAGRNEFANFLLKNGAIIPTFETPFNPGFFDFKTVLSRQLGEFSRLQEDYKIRFIDFKCGEDPSRGVSFEVSALLLLHDRPLWPGEHNARRIHFPSTNGAAMLAVIKAAANISKISDWSLLIWDDLRTPAIAPGDPLLNYRDPVYQPNPSIEDVKYFVIVFPYLKLNSIKRWKDQRESDTDMKNKVLNIAPGPGKHAFGPYLERTLDEVYYPRLDHTTLEKLNHDQVVSREFKRKRMTNTKDEEHEAVPILVVPEMWIWKLGNVLVSAFSGPVSWSGLSDREIMNDPFSETRVAMILAEKIKSFGEMTYIGGKEFPPALDIFETEVVFILSNVDNYLEEGKPSSIDFSKEKRFLHILSDIRSELVMISHVLKQQKKVFNKLVKDGKKSHDQDEYDEIGEAQDALEIYQERIKKIDGDAERTEKAMLNMLELKRAHATIKDTHNSVLLSTAVIGFTVITIIFAPLAFLTALFALNIDGFQKLRVNITDPQSAYDMSYIGGILAGSEVLTILLTGIAVFAALWYIDILDKHEGKIVNNGGAGKVKEKHKENITKPVSESLREKSRSKRTDLEAQAAGDMSPTSTEMLIGRRTTKNS